MLTIVIYLVTGQWDAAALTIRDLKVKQHTAKNELRRRGSLYDEIPISMQTLPCVRI